METQKPIKKVVIPFNEIDSHGDMYAPGSISPESLEVLKINGTNASLWFNNGLQAGSRNRHLSLDKDNAGFLEWALKQENIISFFNEYPEYRLFGEWLVPHSLKTYKEGAWKKFYVFDLSFDSEGENKYLHYRNYKDALEEYNINYIPPVAIINNPTYEQLIKKLPSNNYLIEDGKGAGEGIIIKRYDFKNRFGRMTWAKIVSSEFKEKHAKVMGAPESEGKKMIEVEIVNKYVTNALCEKVYSKIKNESGWQSKQIPRLLQTVFYDLIKEESWNFVKEFRNPVINYKTLQYLTFEAVKKQLTKVF